MLSISYSAVSAEKYSRSSEHMIFPVRNTGGLGLVDSDKASGFGQVSNEQLLKLNELASHRPFNILHKVKRYDPL